MWLPLYSFSVFYILAFWHAGFENENIKQVDHSCNDEQENQRKDFLAEYNNLLEPDGNRCAARTGDSSGPRPRYSLSNLMTARVISASASPRVFGFMSVHSK
ncbi:MAG TPA: hypothetical protein VMN99_08440 [Anaerolineales bacterium]|nr:hypothetical protein [Anaerolineales bacterium]